MPDFQNPFQGGGVEANVEQQKRLLNQLLAARGQEGADMYKKAGEQAQQALATKIAQYGNNTDAQQAVYNSFVQDAQAAQDQHARTIERQQALNNAYMDQVKAAVPLYATEAQQSNDALRMAYEDRKRREEEQAALQREQMQAQLAETRARTAASRGPSYEEMVAKGILTAKANQAVKNEMLKDVPQEQWTASDAKKAGAAGDRLKYSEAAKALGLDEFTPNASDASAKEIRLIQATIDKAYKSDQSFQQAFDNLMTAADAGALGINKGAGIYTALTANAPRWGLTPEQAKALFSSVDWNDLNTTLSYSRYGSAGSKPENPLD